MDIVVHGTKGGRQIFTPIKIGGLLDVSADASKATAIGQEAFAIRIVENSVIFSKYKIIRDVRGDKRTGFLAFSLFLSNKEILQGKDIVSALNKVSQLYYQKYIPDNDNNLKDVREEWGFLDEIVGDFRNKVKNRAIEDIENMISGSKDDAFAFYESDDKLERYFDQPYQNEYIDYRQILFIKSELKDKPESPLNALRHSENPSDNLTGRIDLDKRIYFLRDFDGTAKNGINIEISIKGRRLRKNDRISSRDLISIRYFRKYFKDFLVKEGSLNDDWIKKYITIVDETSKSLNIDKNIDLEPIEKTITFKIKDWKKEEVNEAEFVCKCNDGGAKSALNNQITFSGLELAKRWLVSARTNWFYSDELQINFESNYLLNNSYVDICLNRHELNVIGLDATSGDLLDNLRFNKKLFIGSEINDQHKIVVSKNGYDSLHFNYCPAENFKDQIHIKLIRSKKKNIDKPSEYEYTASTGKNGRWTDDSLDDRYTNSSTGSDLEKKIKPHKGWRFVKFEKEGYLLFAKYEKTKGKFENPKAIALALFIFVVLVFGLWGLYSLFREEQVEKTPKLNYDYIKTYIEGESLILDTLKVYRAKLDSEQKELSDKLDSTIKLRENIDGKYFNSLKKMQLFSSLDKEFQNTIEKINNDQSNTIRNSLGDISSWNLNKIKDTINSILVKINPKTEANPSEVDKVSETRTRKSDVEDSNHKSITKPVILEQENNQASHSNAKNSEIIFSELQKGTITRDQLKDWKKSSHKKYTKSIDLYLQFFELVKNSKQMNEFKNLNSKVTSDTNLSKSELKKYLARICESPKAFDTFINANGIKVCATLNQLKQKVKL